jgi:hypothetical protein
MHGDSFAAKYLANNWQLSGITTIATGRPAGSPTYRETSTAVSNLLATSSINGFGTNRVPFLPINSIYTPTSYRADLRLTKNIPFNVKDREIKGQLAFEAFNQHRHPGIHAGEGHPDAVSGRFRLWHG